MIMFSHFYLLLGLSYADGIISLCLNFGYIGVAVFFLLSGYSLMISKINKPNYLKGFIKNRLLRLYVPFLIVYLIDVVIILIMGKEITLNDLLFIPLMSLPGTLNWYLKVQLGLYILFYILAKLIKNNNTLIISTFGVCLVYMIIGFSTGIAAHWYERIFASPLGVLLNSKKDSTFLILSKRYYISLPISIVLFLLFLAPYFLLGGTLLEIFFILGFLQLVVCICAKLAGKVSNMIFTFLGTISLELYLVHMLIIGHFLNANLLINVSFLFGIVVLF